MKIRLLACLWLLAVQVRAQYVSEFVREARYHLADSDTLTLISTTGTGSGTINVLTDSVAAIEQLLVNYIADNYRTTSRLDTLRESRVLRQLSQIACRRISGVVGAKPEKAARIKRKLYRVFRSSKSSFGLISIVAFDLELVHTSGRFYYDKKGSAGGFNLYDGKRKPKTTQAEPEPEVKPLTVYKEDEMYRQISADARREGLNRELRSGLVSCVGYAVIPNRTTFFRKKVPTVTVIVITGTRRLRLIQ